MTVLKAILLTLLLISVFGLTQVGFVHAFHKTDLISGSAQEHFGLATLVSFLLAYFVVFKYFWKPKADNEEILNFGKMEFRILPFLILIVFGLHLLNGPFWDIGRIWNYIQYSEYDTGFSTFNGIGPNFLYGLITTLIVSP